MLIIVTVNTPQHGDHAQEVHDLLRRQDFVFRYSDVSAWLTWSQVRQEIRAGRWRRVHRGIYVAHNGPVSRQQERRICLLAAPPGSALAGLTAAELDGLEGFSVNDAYLVVPAGLRRPERPGLITKLSHWLGPEDVHPAREPRRTRMARSLVDGASWSTSDNYARAIVLAGVQQRLVRCADLRDALSRRGPCFRHALIVESIDDAEGGIASLPEREFDLIRRRCRLPEPRRQAIVQGPDGRHYLDADWPVFGVTAEVHGSQHLEVVTWNADLDRLAVIAAHGRRVLQFTSHAVVISANASVPCSPMPCATAAGEAEPVTS